jgi:hypothetical protein
VQVNEKGAKKTNRTRYWSVMLVGDHGRVIPFRHFKALTIGVGIVLISSLGALILLSIMYLNLRQQYVVLQKNLDETHAQTAKFRDEKDLYLTRLIALQKQTGELPQSPPSENASLKAKTQPEAIVPKQQISEDVKPAPKQVKKDAVVVKPEPQIHWAADIRNFNVSYDNRQRILKAEFRIYNTSNPKKTLTGRTVVVFKASDDPPIQWATVPSVQLRDGKPAGNNGKSFRVKNYRTENFKTLRGKYSAEYDTVSVYIFTEQGDLIANQEMSFNVDYSPPAPPKPVEPVSAPVQEKPAATPAMPLKDLSAPAEGKPVKPAAPNQGVSDAVPQRVNTPEAAPPVAPNPVLSPENNTQESQRSMDDKSVIEPVKTESGSQPPAAEPQPALEGGPK